MTKVTMEMAEKFRQQHVGGRSFLAIAEENDLDNKTVSHWVKKAQDALNEQHWTEVGTDLDARFLREHHQMLLAAARGVLRAVETSPKSVGPSQSAEVLLKAQVLAELQNLDEILAGRGIDVVEGEPGYSGEDDWDLLDGMASKLQVGLLQHLPELKAAVEQWASDWQRFRDAKDELVQETAGSFPEKIEAVEAKELASNAVDLLLKSEIEGMNYEVPPASELEFAVSQAHGRMETALGALGRVRVSTASCRALVEDVFLRGGPPGKCQYCPGGIPG